MEFSENTESVVSIPNAVINDVTSTPSSQLLETMRDWERQISGDLGFIVRREMEGSKFGRQRKEITEFSKFVKDFFPHFECVDEERLASATNIVKKGEGVTIEVNGIVPFYVPMNTIPDRKFSAITSLFPHMYSDELLGFVYPTPPPHSLLN